MPYSQKAWQWIGTGAKLLIVICLYICICVCTAYMLAGGYQSGLFQSGAVERVVAAGFAAGAVVLFYVLLDAGMKRLRQRNRYMVLALLLLGVCVTMAMMTPYSPGHDSYEMANFLQMLLEGKSSEYSRAYLTAYATNKMVVWMYFPFVKLFGSVETGTRIFNMLLMAGSMLFVGASCKKLYGDRVAEVSAVVLAVFFPFMLLTGPYIYLPAVFLSAAAFYCYNRGTVLARIWFLAVGGILFTVRPMACGFLLVYVCSHDWWEGPRKWKLAKGLGRTAAALACFLLIQAAAGAVLYQIKAHPYPKLENIAGLWTVEIGTRPQEGDTGLCTYFPYTEPGFDRVSEQFHEIWQLYSRADEADYQDIQRLKQDIGTPIELRIKNDVLKDGASIWEFISAKFKNYFSDNYKPYYYTANLYAPDFGDDVSHYYEKRYFLQMNSLLLVFMLSALGVLAFAVYKIRQKQEDAEASSQVSLVLGVVAASVVALAATEVGKRLVFDSTIPICLVISFALGRVAQQVAAARRGKLALAGCLVGAAVTAGGLAAVYGRYRIAPFAGCTVRMDQEQITLTFREPVPEAGYSIRELDGTVTSLDGKSSVTIKNGDNMSNFAYIGLPDGTLYSISKLPLD